MNFQFNLVQFTRNAQPAIIELFTLCAPYAAAALPAALSGGNVTAHIMPANSGLWGVAVGIAAGGALEMIGLAVGWVIVNIISKTRGLPFLKNWKLMAALYAGLHYVGANLAANVGIVAFGQNPVTLGVATGALSTMSVPAVIVCVLWALEIEEKNASAATTATKTQDAKEARAQYYKHKEEMARIKYGTPQATEPRKPQAQRNRNYDMTELALAVANKRNHISQNELIYWLRDAHEVAGKDIAELIGIDPSNVSRALKARPNGNGG